ncbi:hypothetical protein T06_6171 [Trichinella sp. T6]|nr:hypothetical protein T06_6171 [Trichinella sp. T6]
MCDDDHEIAPAHHVYFFVGRPAHYNPLYSVLYPLFTINSLYHKWCVLIERLTAPQMASAAGSTARNGLGRRRY